MQPKGNVFVIVVVVGNGVQRGENKQDVVVIWVPWLPKLNDGVDMLVKGTAETPARVHGRGKGGSDLAWARHDCLVSC